MDSCCFGWAVTSAVCVPDGPSWATSAYPRFDHIGNFTGINFPVKLDQIPQFETLITRQ